MRRLDILQLFSHQFNLTLLDGFLHVGVETILSLSRVYSVNFRIRMTNLLTNTGSVKVVLEDWEIGLSENELYCLIKKHKTQFVFM